MFTRVCQTLKPTRTKNRPSFFWSRIRPANGARIRPISMVPCERKADLDEFEHGLEFVRCRVNGVLITPNVNRNRCLFNRQTNIEQQSQILACKTVKTNLPYTSLFPILNQFLSFLQRNIGKKSLNRIV